MGFWVSFCLNHVRNVVSLQAVKRESFTAFVLVEPLIYYLRPHCLETLLCVKLSSATTVF